MARRPEYTLVITNPAGSQVVETIGEPDPETSTPGWTEINLKPRHMVVGYGDFTCPATPAILAAVNTPENRVIVQREEDGAGVQVEMCGPIEAVPTGYQAERDGDDGPGRVTVRFASDDARLADRLVYPSPNLAATAQTVTTRYTITGANPEDAMRALFNLNAGPGALAPRQFPGFVLGADLGLLPGVTVSTSFTRDTVLTDALREVSRLSAGGNGGLGLGYRLVQVGATIEFQVFKPRDLSGVVVFGREFGNVESLDYEPTAPVDTVAIVGDATAGTGRIVKERINTAALAAGWFRRERWVDAAGAANATELEQAGDKALDEGGATYRVSVVARETPDCRWRYDFAPGDQGSVEVAPGVFVTALVQGADITVTGERGEIVKPIIATSAESLMPAQALEIRKIWRALNAKSGAL
jgi:hypothetical protein